MNKRGFTLVELMVVVAVMAILATMALFGLSTAQKSARDTQRIQIMSALRSSLEKYNGDNNAYPAGAFNSMISSLALPSNPVDPGNGGGSVTYPNGATTAGMWIPVSGVTYSYVTGSGTYTLLLIKEGGGSNRFANPQ